MTLDQLARGDEARIRLHPDGGFGLRRHLEALGLYPGDAVRVVQVSALRGPVLVEASGRRLAIGRGVASRVFVQVEDAAERAGGK
jgi:ferrous iron transport protein A